MIMTYPDTLDFQNLRYLEINQQDLKNLAEIIPSEKIQFFPEGYPTFQFWKNPPKNALKGSFGGCLEFLRWDVENNF